MAIENTQSFVDTYLNGDLIPIANAQDLRTAEDVLARILLPPTEATITAASQYEYLWNMRSNLFDDLHGKDFSGRLTNLQITDLPSAYDELVIEQKVRTYKDREAGMAPTLGFIATANMSSSASKDVGTLVKPVWLIRTPAGKISTKGPWERYVGNDIGDNRVTELRMLSSQRAGGRGRRL